MKKMIFILFPIIFILSLQAGTIELEIELSQPLDYDTPYEIIQLVEGDSVVVDSGDLTAGDSLFQKTIEFVNANDNQVSKPKQNKISPNPFYKDSRTSVEYFYKGSAEITKLTLLNSRGNITSNHPIKLFNLKGQQVLEINEAGSKKFKLAQGVYFIKPKNILKKTYERSDSEPQLFFRILQSPFSFEQEIELIPEITNFIENTLTDTVSARPVYFNEDGIKTIAEAVRLFNITPDGNYTAVTQTDDNGKVHFKYAYGDSCHTFATIPSQDWNHYSGIAVNTDGDTPVPYLDFPHKTKTEKGEWLFTKIVPSDISVENFLNLIHFGAWGNDGGVCYKGTNGEPYKHYVNPQTDFNPNTSDGQSHRQDAINALNYRTAIKHFGATCLNENNIPDEYKWTLDEDFNFVSPAERYTQEDALKDTLETITKEFFIADKPETGYPEDENYSIIEWGGNGTGDLQRNIEDGTCYGQQISIDNSVSGSAKEMLSKEVPNEAGGLDSIFDSGSYNPRTDAFALHLVDYMNKPSEEEGKFVGHSTQIVANLLEYVDGQLNRTTKKGGDYLEETYDNFQEGDYLIYDPNK